MWRACVLYTTNWAVFLGFLFLALPVFRQCSEEDDNKQRGKEREKGARKRRAQMFPQSAALCCGPIVLQNRAAPEYDFPSTNPRSVLCGVFF